MHRIDKFYISIVFGEYTHRLTYLPERLTEVFTAVSSQKYVFCIAEIDSVKHFIRKSIVFTYGCAQCVNNGIAGHIHIVRNIFTLKVFPVGIGRRKMQVCKT